MQRLIFMLLLFGVLAIKTTYSRSVIIKRYAEPEEGREKKEIAKPQVPDSIKKGSKFFQDIYSAQNSPYELEFGHVRETPDDWEQRFEKADFNNNIRQGKVRWGDKDGGYGEHYWDLNHAGVNNDEDVEKNEQETQQHTQHVDQQQQQEPQQIADQPPQSDPKNEAKLDEKAVNESDAALLNSRIQRQTNEAEFINNEAKELYESGKMQKHGGNYGREEEKINYERAKRENKLDENDEEMVTWW